MSREVEDTNERVEEDFAISQFESFNIVSDYIQSPEVIAEISIDKLMEETRDQIKNAERIEEPPFISGIYGGIRREAYIKFNKIIEHYSGAKRNQYKKIFYQEFDINNEKLFDTSMPITEYYRDEIFKQRNKNSVKKSRREYDLSESDLTSQYLGDEVDELIFKWFILIDQTLNELIRCELYELKDEASFRELFVNSSAQLKKKQGSSSWSDWFSDSFWSFGFLKNIFSSNQKPVEKENAAKIDLKEFYELTRAMCCEEIVLGYCNNFDHHYNERILIKMKGFMILLTQNLEAYHQTLSRLVHKVLMNDNKDDHDRYQKSLADVFEQLKNLDQNMATFDQGCLRDYFKEEIKEVSTGVTYPSDEASQVAADFLRQ